jgi:hypothetical protein
MNTAQRLWSRGVFPPRALSCGSSVPPGFACDGPRPLALSSLDQTAISFMPMWSGVTADVFVLPAATVRDVRGFRKAEE